jgi:hypothetical protein
LVLEAYSRVSDVVDHCTFPDYQVLRTLHTLIDRGMVELRHEPVAARPSRTPGLVSRPRCERLKEWIGIDSAFAGAEGGAAHERGAANERDAEEKRDAKLLVVAADTAAVHEFRRLIQGLPGMTLVDRWQGEGIEDLGPMAHLALDDCVGIEMLRVPTDTRVAPLWPLAGHGALGILFLLSGSVASAVETVRPAAEVLRQLPRARIFHLLLLEKGTGVEPDALRENLSLFDDSSLFLIPTENKDTAEVLLREMFVRILP